MKYRKWQGEPLGSLRTEQAVREHFGMGPDDVAYIIEDDEGRPVVFQYHAPFVGGRRPMRGDDWEDWAKQHLGRIQQRLEAIQKAKEQGTFGRPSDEGIL